MHIAPQIFVKVGKLMMSRIVASVLKSLDVFRIWKYVRACFVHASFLQTTNAVTAIFGTLKSIFYSLAHRD